MILERDGRRKETDDHAEIVRLRQVGWMIVHEAEPEKESDERTDDQPES